MLSLLKVDPSGRSSALAYDVDWPVSLFFSGLFLMVALLTEIFLHSKSLVMDGNIRQRGRPFEILRKIKVIHLQRFLSSFLLRPRAG